MSDRWLNIQHAERLAANRAARLATVREAQALAVRNNARRAAAEQPRPATTTSLSGGAS